MRVLAINTAFTDGRIGLVTDGVLTADDTLEAGHLESNTFASVLKLGVQPDLSNIDLIALAAGPGSFTGLKIGAMVAKSLSFLQGTPFKGVGTLPWLAASADAGIILALIRSHGKKFYWGLFKLADAETPGIPPVALMPPSASDAPGIVSAVRAGGFDKDVNAVIPSGDDDPPDIPWPVSRVDLSLALLANLAEQKFEVERTDDPITFTPIYISRSQAEEKMKKKENEISN